MGKFFDCEPLWGSWYLEEEIGSGSFGHVYKAVHTELGRKYYSAVKHISIPADSAQLRSVEAMTDDVKGYFESFAMDIRKEVDTMYTLRGYTNIVNYEDCQFVPKPDGIGYDVFIRMELLTGLERLGRLGRGEVIKLGIDICSALEVCERKKVVHRDIKPQNIFRNENGDYKLGDFGIARAMERTVGSVSMSFAGTPPYMAPEIYKQQHAGYPADIYSLGIVLYQLLNGNRLPFVKKKQSTDGAAIRQEYELAKARRLSGEALPAPENADRELSKVILKACEYEPDNRYRSAAQFKAALQKLLTENVSEKDKDSAVTKKNAGAYVTSDDHRKTAPARAAKAAAPGYGSIASLSDKYNKSRKFLLITGTAMFVIHILFLINAIPRIAEDADRIDMTIPLILFLTELICLISIGILKRRQERGIGSKLLAAVLTTLAIAAPLIICILVVTDAIGTYSSWTQDIVVGVVSSGFVNVALTEYYIRNEINIIKNKIPSGVKAVIWGVLGAVMLLLMYVMQLYLMEWYWEGVLVVPMMFIPMSIWYLCYRSDKDKGGKISVPFVIGIIQVLLYVFLVLLVFA